MSLLFFRRPTYRHWLRKLHPHTPPIAQKKAAFATKTLHARFSVLWINFSQTYTYTFILKIVSELIFRWCKFSCHAKLAAPKLTLTPPNLFRKNQFYPNLHLQLRFLSCVNWKTSFSVLRIVRFPFCQVFLEEQQACLQTSGKKKKNTNPNFWVRISSGGVGVFHMKVGGQKVLYVLRIRNPVKPNLWAGYPHFCQDIPGVPETFGKENYVQVLGQWPYNKCSKSCNFIAMVIAIPIMNRKSQAMWDSVNLRKVHCSDLLYSK